MLRKATKVHMYGLAIFPSLRGLPEVWPQLDTVIIEVSSVKGLSLRGNTLRLYRAQHLPLMNWTYGDTRIYSGQSSYLNMKILTFAKEKNMRFFFKPLLAWVMIKSDHTNVSHDLQLLSFVQRLRYAHHSKAAPISYTFLVANYWSSTATATLTVW